MTKDELMRENESLRNLLMEIREMIDSALSDEDYDDMDEEEEEDDEDYPEDDD